MRDRSSVATAAPRWRAAFVAAFALVTAIKFCIAATLAPFGDEAFYWQESRHLAWGYSDLPPMTAWLIRLGEAAAGHGLLGMRWPFLVLGAALPWLTAYFARRHFGDRAGWQAGLFCLVLPLAGSLGVLALPDVPLTLAILVALVALDRAMQTDAWGDWLPVGIALAIAWATHYRAAMPMLAGLVLLSATPRGRRQWRRPGLWGALGVAALGLAPLIVSNLRQHGAGLAFQLVERNPWSFHADALVQPLEQALACTPLLYAMLLWAGWRCWHRRAEGGPWDIGAAMAVSFLAGYFVLGLFADDSRFRLHWPLPGYLPLLAVLPALLASSVGSWRRWLPAAAFVLAALGQLAVLAYLGMAGTRAGADALTGFKAFPDNFVGWRESGAAVRASLRDAPAGSVLVADNFMLAAEIDFQLDGRRPVYALDSPLNTKHGRAPQLAVWQLDGEALRARHAGAPMLLAVEETGLRERQRPHWLGGLCRRIEKPRPLRRLDLYGGRKRIAFYAGTVPAHLGPVRPRDDCTIWWRAYQAMLRFEG